MPLSALALVILAGLIHASWNIDAKRTGGDARFAMLTSIALAIVWAPLGLPLAWQAVPGWGVLEWFVILVSGVLHVAYFLVLLRGYRHADLTVVYPLARGTGPLLSALVAITVLGKTLSISAGLGVVAVVLGVFLIAGGPGLWRAARDPAHSGRVRTGLFYGVATGIFIAGYTVVDGSGVKLLGMSPILIDYMGNWVRILILMPLVLQPGANLRATWGAQWKTALLIGTISPVAYVLVLYAMQMAPLSMVAPAREISMLFAALMSGRLLAEGDRGPRIAGAAKIALGVMAFAMG